MPSDKKKKHLFGGGEGNDGAGAEVSPEKVYGKRKLGQEIEDIFRVGFKKKKQEQMEEEKDQSSQRMKRNIEEEKVRDEMVKGGVPNKKAKKKNKKERGGSSSRLGFPDPGIKASKKKTSDGLVIYSAEELGVGNPDAGGTPLCPFDCSCCF